MARQQHKIATGYDNTGSLVLWRSYQDAEGIYYPPVRSYPNWRQGELVINGDLSSNHDGTPVQRWEIGAVEASTYFDIVDRFCETGFYYGYVTVATNQQQIDVFANYNAILHVPQPAELQWDNEGDWISKLTLTLMIVEAL